MITALTTALGGLCERPDLPLPRGFCPPGDSLPIVVGSTSAHPADVVEVLLRRVGRRTRTVRALREPRTGGVTQWFRSQLPPVGTREFDEYRVVLTRAGQRLATLPADGSWLRLTPATTAPAPPTDQTGSGSAGSAPPGAAIDTQHRDATWPCRQRFAYELEFFAALTADLQAHILGATPHGYRINFSVLDGRVLGPRIDAIIQPTGGDWMYIRRDGIGRPNIIITYETSDGALILEQAEGVFDLGSEGYAKAASGDFTGSPEFYAAPTWSTAHPDWQWLNRRQGFGFGRVVLEKLQVQCDLYFPRVGERLGDA